MELQLHAEELETGAWLVRVGGNLDNETYLRFESGLEELEAKNPRQILLCMNEVKYISSSGLGALFRAKRKLEAVSAFFGVYDASVAVRRVLVISKSGALLVSADRFAPGTPFYPYVAVREAEKRKEAEARSKSGKTAESRAPKG